MKLNKHHINRSPEVQQELESLSPFLAGIPKKQAHEAPAYYFNTLGDKVMHRIEAEQTPGLMARLDIWLQQMFTPRLALAVAAVFVFAIGTVGLLQVDGTSMVTATEPVSMASLSTADLNMVLATVDDYEAAEYMGAGVLTQLQGDIDYWDNTTNTADLNPYLDNIDEELILEELL